MAKTDTINNVIGIFLSIIALAALAVILTKKSNSAAVISSALGGFSGILASTLKPVTG